MAADRAKVAQEALAALDSLVKSTVQILTAYQTAGSQDSESSSLELGIRLLRTEKERHAIALRTLREKLQLLADSPSLSGPIGALLRQLLSGSDQKLVAVGP